MEQKQLDARGKGEVDYDFKNDILFFKIKEREYLKSLDFDEFILDIDQEGFVTGIQIFDASDVFKVDKGILQNVGKWELHIKVEGNVIKLQLIFEGLHRNKVFTENFVRESSSPLQDAEVLCEV